MQEAKQTRYTGRFAPSPTGDLHFGSLVAATASFLQARSENGRWLIRIDNIDPPREKAGSVASILADLDRLGMRPDEDVQYQADRLGEYEEARDRLLDESLAYYCGCARSELPPGPYPGTCANGLVAGRKARSVRLRVAPDPVHFEDLIQGPLSYDLRNSCGDFVIWRADGLPAYQLATAIDDVNPPISEVVRGADLLDSTPRQISVRQAMRLGSPRYAHIPVARINGKKLSKRNFTTPYLGSIQYQ